MLKLREELEQGLERLFKPNWLMFTSAACVVALFISAVVILKTLSTGTVYGMVDTYPEWRRLNRQFYLFKSTHEFQKKRQNKDTREIVIIGGSTTREAIYDENELARILTKELGKTFSVTDFTSSAQSLSLSNILTWQTLCQGAELALIGVGFGRAGNIDQYPHIKRMVLAFDSNLPMKVRSHFNQTDVGLLSENLKFFANYVFSVMQYAIYDITGIKAKGVNSSPPKVFTRHLYYQKKKLSADQFTRLLEDAGPHHISGFLNNRIGFKKFIQSVAEAQKECGGSVIIFDTPFNPMIFNSEKFSEYAKVAMMYRHFIETEVRSAGLHYFNINNGAHFRPEEFYDFGHLSTVPSSRKATQILSQEIIKNLQ